MTERHIVLKHLPCLISIDDIEDLVNIFHGKVVYEYFSKNNKRIYVLVEFENHSQAFNAVNRLHQLIILRHRITVELARNSCVKAANHAIAKKVLKYHSEKEAKNNKKIESGPVEEGSIVNDHSCGVKICPNLRIHQCFKNYSSYKYPKPDNQTITNIIYLLYSSPEFYNNVVNILNFMNLPPPFSANFDKMTFGENIRLTDSISPMEKSIPPLYTQPTNYFRSDIEESSQFSACKRHVCTDPLFKPPEDQIKESSSIDEYFDRIKASISKNKWIESFKSISLLVNQCKKRTNVDKPTHDSQINQTLPQREDVITSEELKNLQTPFNQIEKLEVFKNYNEGQISNRLYIKNLTSQVTLNDLRRIYLYFVRKLSIEEKKLFDVAIFNSGKLKNQAFVTFPSPLIATEALKKTNGIVLNGKNIVVQYARSIKPDMESIVTQPKNA